MIVDSILKVLQNYFDALYFGNVQILSYLFHPQALDVNATATPIHRQEVTLWLKDEMHHPSAASQNHYRKDKIVEVKRVGENMATATVERIINGSQYQEVLTLILIDQQWRIMSRVTNNKPCIMAAA